MDQRSRLAFGRCELDVAARVLCRDGRRVDLQPKVLDLLVFLIDQRDRVVSRDELLDALWPGVAVTPAALSRAVHKAREAVGDDGAAQDVIETSHGHGFRFVAELVEAPAPGGEALPASSPVASSPIAAHRAPGGRSARHRALAAAGLVAAVLALVSFGSRGFRARARSPDLPRATAVAALPFSGIRTHGDPQDLAEGAVLVEVTWSAQVQNLGFNLFTLQPILDDHPIGDGTVSGSLGNYDVTTAGGATLIVPLLSPLTGPPHPTASQLLDATTSGFASGFPNAWWILHIFGAPFTLHNPFPLDYGDIGELHITVPMDLFDEGSYAANLLATRLPPGVPQRVSQMVPGCSTSYPAFYCQVRILDLDRKDAALVEYRVGDAAVLQGQSIGLLEDRFTVRQASGDGGR